MMQGTMKIRPLVMSTSIQPCRDWRMVDFENLGHTHHISYIITNMLLDEEARSEQRNPSMSRGGFNP